MKALPLLALLLAPAGAALPLSDPLVSQYHDTCAMLVGERPECGADHPVSQAQACPHGLALPGLGGGWVGEARHNGNGALQEACARLP